MAWRDSTLRRRGGHRRRRGVRLRRLLLRQPAPPAAIALDRGGERERQVARGDVRGERGGDRRGPDDDRRAPVAELGRLVGGFRLGGLEAIEREPTALALAVAQGDAAGLADNRDTAGHIPDLRPAKDRPAEATGRDDPDLVGDRAE